MSDQLFLTAIIGPFYLILGLSVVLYSEAWKRLGDEWQKDHKALIGIMMFSLIFGLAVINMHNLWEWSPFVIVTITGWAAFLKGVAYFLLPARSLRSMIETFNHEKYYKGVGIVMGILGLWLSYLVYIA